MAGKLENLEILEVSGVDFPANEFNGWIVLKSKEGETRVDVEQIIEAAQALDAQASSVLKAHEDASDLFSKAPEDVQKAAEAVVKFLKGESDEPVATEATKANTGFLSRTIAALLGIEKQETPAKPDAESEQETTEEVEKTDEVDWNAVISEFRSGGSKDEE